MKSVRNHLDFLACADHFQHFQLPVAQAVGDLLFGAIRFTTTFEITWLAILG